MSTFKSQKRSMFLKLCFAMCLLAISAATAHAATFTVTNTNDSGDGSLRQAIIDANNSADNDTIDFNLAACPCVITLTSGELFIANNGSLTINGPGADQLSVSGNNTSRVFLIWTSVNAAINGITVTGGNGNGTTLFGAGGGIMNSGTLTLANSIVSNNSTGSGGGVYNAAFSSLTLTNSTVANNSAEVSGGGIINSSGTVTVINSIVRGNSAARGGGINNSGSANITGSAISGNSAGSMGGAIYTSPGHLTVERSTLSGNHAGNYGGAIMGSSATISLTNSTVSGNTAYYGAGIYNQSSPLHITSSTLAANRAQSIGGGIYVYGSVTLTSSIVAGNFTGSGDTMSDIGNTLSSASVNNTLIGDAGSAGGIVDGANGNIVGADPMLGPLADNGGQTMTHALLPGSPAIDAGTNPLNLLTDQRGSGFDRVVGAAADIGAFEVETVICPRPQGYWKNNPDAWPVEELTLGEEVYTKAELLAILNTPAGTGKNADASLILAYQLIAAKLNAESGANTDSVDATIEAADALLSWYDGRLPLRVRSSTANGQLMLGYGSTLDAFNKATNTTGCIQ